MQLQIIIDYDAHPDLGGRQAIYEVTVQGRKQISSRELIGKRITRVDDSDDQIMLVLE